MNKGIDFVKLDTTLMDLPTLKSYRFGEIDYKTEILIGIGFVFDGETFSLSPNAQRNWDSIKTSKADYTFPLNVSTIDNNVYSLTNPNVQAFWVAARDALKNHLDSGRILKKAIFDAIDIPAVDAVIDNR